MMTRGKRRRDDRGAAAVELALLLPFACAAGLAAVNSGLALRCAAAVAECARSGATAAIDPDVGDAALEAAIRATAEAAAADLDSAPTITIGLGTDAEGFAYVDVTASYTFHGLHRERPD